MPTFKNMDQPTRKRKRKRHTSPQPSPLAPSTASASYKTGLKQDAEKLSLLLDLPPELLRNLVYEMMLQRTKAVLSTSTNRRTLGSSSSLPRVNKQVREEFGNILLLVADVHTVAKEFDFRRIGQYESYA